VPFIDFEFAIRATVPEQQQGEIRAGGLRHPCPMLDFCWKSNPGGVFASASVIA
jgi:hypothetical protein